MTERRTTILDATMTVLADGRPRTSQEIHDEIVKRALFTFRAQDPVAMVRAAIRKHIRKTGESSAKVKKAGKDQWART